MERKHVFVAAQISKFPWEFGWSWYVQGTNISPKNGILKMILVSPRWDMLVPRRAYLLHLLLKTAAVPSHPLGKCHVLLLLPPSFAEFDRSSRSSHRTPWNEWRHWRPLPEEKNGGNGCETTRNGERSYLQRGGVFLRWLCFFLDFVWSK